MVKTINKKHFNKTGSINFLIINLGIIMILIMLFSIFVIYTQVVNTVMNIKNDLYYITQNGILASDKENLALYNYSVDNVALKNNIENILKKNYVKTGGSVFNITVKNVSNYTNPTEIYTHTLGRYNKPIIHIEIEVQLVPIIKIINNGGIYKLNVHEDVKISMLTYEVN